MKRIFLLLLTLALMLPIVAQVQKERVAVFDPSGTGVDEGTRIAVREIISSTIVNSGKYNIVERSMLEKVMQEQEFSNSGAVDDSQATEIGRLTGASKVLVSILTKTGGQNVLSIKLIDVMTANIERQKVQVVSPGDLLNIIEPITLNLINATNQGEGIKISDSSTSIPFETSSTVTTPIPGKDELIFFLPSGYQPKKEKDKDLPIQVVFNKEFVGGGTLGDGFLIRVPNPGPGVYKIRFGVQSYKIDTNKYNFFKFQVYRWVYLGKSMYNLNLVEMKMIK